MTLVTKPLKGTKILPGKWVYDIKQDTEGYILEFRARWVVCGNRQSLGVDFQPDERYALVVLDVSAKLFITMAAIRNWKKEQWDVIGAYLNAAIDNRIIFMKQPTGHEQFGLKGEDLRRNAYPRKDDMVAYKVLLQYLAGTTNLGILFGKEPLKGLEGFVDLSYADAEDRKSTEVYIWFFAGALILWSSKRQDIVVALSTMAEYCALATAAKEGLYLAKIAADLLLMPLLNQDEEFDKNIPITLFCDSDNAITTVMNPKVSPKLSWISTRYHLIRDLIKKNLV
ncbi:hypothetical protein PDE_06251 [Penicillium oxalicum 114-2]|uniref:Reverse transcriptase Ty1/copia-type domain-containing protein n=1 Tax=Penicillium oxalicum (strain 114-2 / CGMCC 5302) TaxID=933388 RepID=S7ZRL1_PENO1|nr:hypothetical protein PDE_06251 [Penicillium oxalicum 114-2]